MDFEFTPDQQRCAPPSRICERYPDEYWLERDREGGFPEPLHADLARDGWLASPCRRNTAAPAWA